MKRYLLAALLPCALALPVHAQTTPKERPATEKLAPEDSEMKAVQTEMAAYGAWLVRLDAANQEATNELQNIQSEWRAAAKAPAAQAVARFRPVVARAKVKVAEARLRVRALDTPAFPALDLDADSSTPALVAQVLKLYDRIDMLLDSFGPMLTAMARNDAQATISAASQMLDAAQLLLDTQAILINAGLATADREMGSYQVGLLQVRIFQAASRSMGAAKLAMVGKQDPGLARDLERFATEIDAASREGKAVMTAKLAQWDVLTKTGDSDAVQVLRRTSAVLRVDLKLFDATPAYTAVLRATAAHARAGRLAIGDISAVSRAFGEIRNLINEISTQENAAMAGS
ncbi:hypothetical protein HZY97_04070 [Sphingomonas sp. R-74633]|uniref:hypothetical protein n=1 Tax=Sphingomonas sp. R-74633 TaxID=2751188 RepID=UPI0015D143E1|nr:hypothetical protein [Sphingomonas sp. R-74633]NYT39920.1 hypothetical protein [Sphingomonas sp. R-74633]